MSISVLFVALAPILILILLVLSRFKLLQKLLPIKSEAVNRGKHFSATSHKTSL